MPSGDERVDADAFEAIYFLARLMKAVSVCECIRRRIKAVSSLRQASATSCNEDTFEVSATPYESAVSVSFSWNARKSNDGST